MATLCKLSSCFFSLSSHKLFLNKQQEHNYPLSWIPFELTYQKHFRVCACSVKKTRKVKSNVELCNDIREFVSAVGLPEGHVPSMKELSDHGRTDLAYIVRRRGYKLIRDLLLNSRKGDGSSVENSLAEENSYDMEDQDEEIKHMVEDNALATTALYQVEQQDREVLNVVQDSLALTEVFVNDESEGSSIMHPDFNAEVSVNDESERPSTSVGLSLEEKDLYNSNGQDEHADSLSGDMSLRTGISSGDGDAKNVDIVPGFNVSDHNCMPLNSIVNSSYEEKVANFIQNGNLDAIEDNLHGISFENNAEESEEFEHVVSRSSTTLTLNGSVSTSQQVTPSVTVNHPLRKTHLSAEGPTNADIDKDLDSESSKRENQVEINHLKFMLHQKELELSRLKEQIEKERLALSASQAKAETEINKIKRLISEKDAELHAAEESLSGLVEVKIQYRGDGEIVEVAGSFNGWHHRIKMDPQPSTSFTDPIVSRKPRFWSTMLWLYPGTYEIKFVVDGHWKTDPERESVTKGGICNNILQVGR